MTILPVTRQDWLAISNLQPEGWPEILPYMMFYTKSPFCFPHKVIIDDTIAGIGTGIVHGQTGWLGHIIVLPEFRNRGIGKAITQALIDTLRARGCTSLYLIATDLGAPVYAKVGFETETEYLFFKDTRADQGPISEYVTPFRPEHLVQIAALDREVSGEDRMVEFELYLDGCQIYQEGNTLEGFYIPRAGEGLIVAATPAAGIALMKFRLSTREGAVFPVDNTTACQYLYARGHKEFKRASRMRLGEKLSWHPVNLYNRVAGNIG